MSSASSRGSASPEEELRLPRAPGVIRQFWARHPIVTDIVVAALVLLLSLVAAAPFSPSEPDEPSEPVAFPAVAFVPLAVLTAVCVLLVWRRRLPTVVFAASIVSALTFLVLSPTLGSPLLLITSYSLAVYRSTRACLTGVGIGLGILVVAGIPLAAYGYAPVTTVIAAVLGEAVLSIIGTLVGINVANRRRYLHAVIDRSRQLLVERDQQAQLAAATERARIAREMHDIVSHSLTVIVALSEGAAATSDQERARAAMEATASTARGALTEMRAMLGVLRDSTTDAPLAPAEPVAPEATVATAQRAGFPVTLAVTGTPHVSDQVRFAIGRIVQEGMTNAMRHAPQATSIEVRIQYGEDVIVTVRNDGVAEAAGSGGFGIRGLQERVTHVGGSLTSAPDATGTWVLRAELPAGVAAAHAPERNPA